MYHFNSQEEVKTLRDSIAETYSEWLEMAGEQSPDVLVNILSSLLLSEKKENAYIRKMNFREIGNECASTTK
jgi:hypothetical protein